MSELLAAFAALSPAEQYALGLIAFPIFLLVIGAAIAVVLLHGADGRRGPPARRGDTRMNQLRHIRKNVFGVTQVEMAAIAGVSQGQVSRWELGINVPSLPDLARIRDEALRRGLPWDDRWFFEVAA